MGALRRVTGGRAERRKLARRLRARVLGHPALDDATRAARLLAAADELGLGAEEVAALLWIDLASERPVTLPGGRPDELELAAFANLDRIQRAVRRARTLRLRVWGDAHELIRTARRYGLLATVLAADDATVLDVIGPLSLFHATTVYGRALAALVPLLADHPRFVLELDCDFGRGPVELRVAPPARLPPVAAGRATPSLAHRLARDLEKAAPELRIVRDPPPIASGADLMFPDVGVGAWLIEIVGFATASFVASRVARYAAAGVTNLILCVDEQRSEAVPPTRNLVAFRKHVDPARVLATMAAAHDG
jgi:predicted nuclease of restriction endonuclease-like RecB superfamily